MNKKISGCTFASRSRFLPLRKLGKGGYGTVFLFKRVSSGTLHAVKLIPDARCKRKTWCPKQQFWIPDEIMLTQDLDHRNLLNLDEVYFEQNCWVLLMEYLPNYVDLFEYIAENGRMNEGDARIILKQVVEVCNYLISKGIDHQDVKGENILYNPVTKHIRLIDFGCASQISDDRYSRLCGTKLYIPPEFYSTGSYLALPATTWALGCLAYVLLSGYRPFETSRQITDCDSLASLLRNPCLSKGSRAFLRDLLEVDENKRILPAFLCFHPWLRPRTLEESDFI